jgi:hypothetical protein
VLCDVQVLGVDIERCGALATVQRSALTICLSYVFCDLQVMGVVRQLQSSGQPLEMNVIIDKVMAQSR